MGCWLCFELFLEFRELGEAQRSQPKFYGPLTCRDSGSLQTCAGSFSSLAWDFEDLGCTPNPDFSSTRILSSILSEPLFSVKRGQDRTLSFGKLLEVLALIAGDVHSAPSVFSNKNAEACVCWGT